VGYYDPRCSIFGRRYLVYRGNLFRTCLSQIEVRSCDDCSAGMFKHNLSRAWVRAESRVVGDDLGLKLPQHLFRGPRNASVALFRRIVRICLARTPALALVSASHSG
jgi:hypothetical protein